jgi:hypothetical protein
LKYLIYLGKFLAVILFAVCVVAAATNAPAVIETDLCSLVAHPKQFDKKQVKVRAQLLRSIHGTALVDSHCKPGVELWIVKEARDRSDFEDLSEKVDHHDNIGTSDKTVFATFTGQFLRHPKDPVTRHRKILVLNATKVEGLEVKYDNAPRP